VRELLDVPVAQRDAVESEAGGVAPQRRPLVQVCRETHQVQLTSPYRRRPAGRPR
jgi:hypothetical protein